MNRDRPEIYKLDFDEGEEHVGLRDFYTDECNVKFIEADNTDHILALDFDDPSILVQDKSDLTKTYRMNLLHAREEFRQAYDLWFHFRSKHKKK